MQSGGHTAESSAREAGNMGMVRSLPGLGFRVFVVCMGMFSHFIVAYVDMKDSFLGHKSFNFLDYLSIFNCRYV